MAVLATVWGARLTFNFARKSGYSGVEDYRWSVLRKAMSPWQFQLFNLFFIVIYQNALLVMITLPGLTALEHCWSSIGAVLLTLLFVGSTIMTERISASKYPRYGDYQTLTSAIVPWPPRMNPQEMALPSASRR